MKDPTLSGCLLWCLLGLFCLRVLGQLLVALRRLRWLPPMQQWYSGLIRYRFLIPSPALGRGVVGFSCVYAAAMLVAGPPLHRPEVVPGAPANISR